jgi:hypothetical protein
MLARLLKQPGLSLKKSRSAVSAKAMLRRLQTSSQTKLSRHQKELFSTTEAEVRDKGERAAKSKPWRGSTDIRARRHPRS